MEPQTAIDLGRDAIMTSMLLSSPLLIVGMVIGLLIGLLQALSQIQDQTVAFVPKMIAMVVALCLSLPWLVQHMLAYSEALITNIPKVISGG